MAMKTFVNLTPHDIVLNDGTIYHSQGVARVSNTFTSPDEYGVCDVVYGDIVNLPQPCDGTLYIVSAIVLAAAKNSGRNDCVAPATGHSDCVRKDGLIVSVPCFVR